jgi:hypothetical protein
LREETEIDQSVKRPLESSLLLGAVVEVGEKENTSIKCNKVSMFSMLNPFRKT